MTNHLVDHLQSQLCLNVQWPYEHRALSHSHAYELRTCTDREALLADAADEQSLLGLALLHLKRNELDACQQQAETALRVNEASAQVLVVHVHRASHLSIDCISSCMSICSTA